ncbi:hypothetical protein GCM10011507_05670 [Edaphobacter acidisoli]|uniref:Uncharacterized protein n=1 Tax=Edaphobacter acidisoli TaxID=2040573 RepID=A0A916W0D3_9BACT|nr:hypothetical protein [Edaphobacter acidisoli]GGA57215.1 hypothetical protein GCM10011507_05670 [Edaphobacter acidisoli]
MGPLRVAVLIALLLPLAGCKSPYVAATISNHTSQPIDLLEMDYPSASFGTQSLAPGADFHYRFKIIGSGNVSITYTTANFHDKKSTGPFLKEGDEGPLEAIIQPDGVRWVPIPAKQP